MAEVTLRIGDRDHRVGCADGQEAHLIWLGKLVAGRWDAAQRASGGVNGERTMLLIALMLADALNDAEARAPTGEHPLLGQLADRLEALATALEQDAPNA
ncbi:MAG: cell division protein ZapA [Sphingomonas sp.]|nr:cell division protein ZapA [Sphingomonas sp.]